MWFLFGLAHFLLLVVITANCGSKKSEIPEAPPKRDHEPKRSQLNEKENMIKMGLKTTKNAYPTEEDVKSDWDDLDKKDKPAESAGQSGQSGSKETVQNGVKTQKTKASELVPSPAQAPTPDK